MALVDLVAGTVPEARKAEIEAHLAECTSCREAVAILLKGRRHDVESGSLTNPDQVSSPLLQLPGAHLGRYEIAETLGAGGMGVVYAAHDPKLDRKVALKVVRNAGPSAEIRLLREAQAMARLQHPNVVTVHDVVAHDKELVIAMELVPGTTLRDWLDAKRRDWPEVVDVFVQAGRGLAAAHKAGLVHRDFKPTNVFVRDDGRVQVGDFGLARLASETIDELEDRTPSASPLTADVTHRGTMIGTPRYMAPEQQTGQADERSDQYSFAITLRESLGERSLPPELTKIIARASAQEPADRFRSIGAVVFALEELRKRAAPNRRRVAAVIGGVAIAAGFGIVLATRSNEPVTTAESGEVIVAMLPFVDRAGTEGRLDWKHAGLPRLLGREIQRANLKVIGTFELRDRTPDPPAENDTAAWRERALALGARYVVTGVLASAGDQAAVAITLVRRDGLPLGAWLIRGAQTAIPSLVGARAEQVVAAIGGTAKAAGPRDFEIERDLTLGIDAFQQLRSADARARFEAVISKDPDHADARYYLALLAWWENAPHDELEKACRAALETELLPEQSGVVGGLISLAGNELDTAIEHFRRLDEKYPTSAHVRYALSEALFHGGYPAEGMTVYRQLGEQWPRWSLALFHALTYYTVHGDEEGMRWAYARLPLLDAAGAEIWQLRRQVARGELHKTFDQIVAARARLPSIELAAGDLEILAMILDERAILAAAKDFWHQFAIALWRGDRVVAEKSLDPLLTNTSDRRLRYNLVHLTPLIAVSRDRAFAERMLGSLDKALGTTKPAINEELARLFLAGVLGKRDTIHALASSLYPEVAAAARAFEANLDGKPAAETWRRAFALTADGVFVVAGRHQLAGALAAAGDHAGVIEQCGLILAPRWLDLSIGPAIPSCLAWSATAHEALGHREQAATMYRRLIAIREDKKDSLRVAAEAALAKLR